MSQSLRNLKPLLFLHQLQGAKKIEGTELEENAMEKEADTEDNVDRETVEVSNKCPDLPDSHSAFGKLLLSKT